MTFFQDRRIKPCVFRAQREENMRVPGTAERKKEAEIPVS